MSESTITVYGQFEADLSAFEAKDAELKFDVNTPDGESDCRTYHRKLRKVYNGVDKLRKKVKEEHLQTCKDIDNEAKKIFTRINAMANPRKALLDAKEAEEQAKIEAIAAANKLKAEIEESEREAHLENGERELAAQQKAMQAKADELKAEEERMANEKRIAEAVEQARIDAEAKAEQDKKDAAEKAERDKVAAVEAEKEKQRLAEDERVRIEEEKVEAAKQAEAEKIAEQARLDKIEADRVADEQHRETIEIAIIDELKKIIDHSGLAGEVMDAIRSGKIPHVKITY